MEQLIVPVVLLVIMIIFGIVFLIAVENIFPPIPSEVILTLGGFMTSQDNCLFVSSITAVLLKV